MAIGLGLGIKYDGKPNLVQRAVSILRKYGTNAHVYLPGVGTLNGLTAGNFIDSTLLTPGAVDNPVGGVIDAVGTINATQSTTANKPTLRRGLYNLALQSNTFTTSPWVNGGTGALTKTETDFQGNANSAWLFTATAGLRYLSQNTAKVQASGEKYTSMFLFKKTTGALARYPVISLELNTLTVLTAVCTIDTTNGTATIWSAYTGFTVVAGATATVSDLGDYWAVCVTYTADRAGTILIGIYPAGASTSTQSTGVVSAGVGSQVIGAIGLFQGTLTANQILAAGGIPLTTTTAASNSTAGNYSWQFDGGDSLALGSVPFQQADDQCVIAAYAANTLASNQAIFGGCTAPGVANPVVCNVELNTTGGGKFIAFWRDDAGGNKTIIGTTTPEIGKQYVVAARKVSTAVSLRVNGTSEIASTATLSTTTVTAATIGATNRLSITNYANGSTGPIILIKGTVTDADLLVLERLVSSMTPNAPQF